jgi:hypothetical protein
VVVLAFSAAEIKDSPILFHEHLAGTRFKLKTAKTTDMLFHHVPSPPRHFLCFTLSFKEHNDISLTDWSYRVARYDPALVVTIENAALNLHCLTVHAG